MLLLVDEMHLISINMEKLLDTGGVQALLGFSCQRPRLTSAKWKVYHMPGIPPPDEKELYTHWSRNNDRYIQENVLEDIVSCTNGYEGLEIKLFLTIIVHLAIRG